MKRRKNVWTDYEKMLSYQKKKFLVCVGANDSKNQKKSQKTGNKEAR